MPTFTLLAAKAPSGFSLLVVVWLTNGRGGLHRLLFGRRRHDLFRELGVIRQEVTRQMRSWRTRSPCRGCPANTTAAPQCRSWRLGARFPTPRLCKPDASRRACSSTSANVPAKGRTAECTQKPVSGWSARPRATRSPSVSVVHHPRPRSVDQFSRDVPHGFTCGLRRTSSPKKCYPTMRMSIPNLKNACWLISKQTVARGHHGPVGQGARRGGGSDRLKELGALRTNGSRGDGLPDAHHLRNASA